MDVDVCELDDARDAWRSGSEGDVERVVLSRLTLGACVETACWAATGNDKLRSFVEGWTVRFPAAAWSLRALTSTSGIPRPDDHDAPSIEVRRCPTHAELADPAVGVAWRYFLDRFRRSLVVRLKLEAKKARGLSAGFHEMADNVVAHAGLGDSPRAVVAYAVTDDQFEFAVGDLGRGVLASLRENAAHSALRADAPALLAATTAGASSRPGGGGRGFSDLLTALADLQGTLSFRSGSARLRLDGRGAADRVALTSNSPYLNGFQLCVAASPRGTVW